MYLNPEFTKLSVNDATRLRLLAAEALYQAFLDEGDFIEMGVFRGGSALWMAIALLQAKSRRTLHLLDSWEGLPELAEQDEGALLTGGFFNTATESQVRELMARLNVGQYCRTYKGWFKDTLPAIPGPFALAHVDGDLYESCKVCLDHVLPRMTPHGSIIVDDYGTPETRRFPGVKKAVQESIEGTEWIVCPPGGERDQSVKLVRSLRD